MANCMRGSRVVFAAAAIWMCFFKLWEPAFLPPAAPASRHSTPPAAAIAGGLSLLGGAAPSFAGGYDGVDAAAIKLAKAAYPAMMKVDWERNPTLNDYLKNSAQSWDPKKVATFVDTVLQTGMQMPMGNIVKAVKAHQHALNDAITKPGLVAPLPDIEDITVAIARLFTSVDTVKSNALYDAYMDAGFSRLNTQFYGGLNGKDVDNTMAAFWALSKEVEKVHR